MNNRRIWFRLGGVLAAAAVCTGGAAVVPDRAQEAKNVQGRSSARWKRRCR